MYGVLPMEKWDDTGKSPWQIVCQFCENEIVEEQSGKQKYY